MSVKEDKEIKKLQEGGKKKKRPSSKTTKSKSGSASKQSKSGSGSKKSTKKNKSNKKDRFFKRINEDTMEGIGRYTGDTPKQAASKSYTKYLQKLRAEKKKIPASTTIYLRESTRGSNRKIYGYAASRVKLKKPQELIIRDTATGKKKKIVYNFRNQIHKAPVPEQIGGGKKKKSSKNKKSSKSKSDKKSKSEKPKKKSGSKTAKKPTGKKNGHKKDKKKK
jgi:hypothetical protein